MIKKWIYLVIFPDSLSKAKNLVALENNNSACLQGPRGLRIAAKVTTGGGTEHLRNGAELAVLGDKPANIAM